MLCDDGVVEKIAVDVFDIWNGFSGLYFGDHFRDCLGGASAPL